MVVMAVASATGRHEHKQGALRAEPARTPCNFKNFWKQIKVECDDPAAVTGAAICKQARNCLGIKATPAETERDNTRLVKLPDGSNCKSTTPAPEDVKSAQQCESACRLTATCKGSVWSGTSCAFCTSLDLSLIHI